MVDEADEEELPLADAILKWCDPDLLKKMRDAEAWSQSLGSMPTPSATIASSMVRAAQKEFLHEVRWRLEIGVILLTGIQVEPELQTARSEIPGEWATLMVFDFNQRAVVCQGRKWIAVRGRVARLSQSTRTESGELADSSRMPNTASCDEIATQIQKDADEAEVAASADQGAAGVVAPRDVQRRDHTADVANQTSVRTRGRESFEALILEGLRLHYADRDLPQAPPNGWTALAKHVGAALEVKYPRRHAEKKLPSPDTIRTRLPRLYAVLQAEAVVQN